MNLGVTRGTGICALLHEMRQQTCPFFSAGRARLSRPVRNRCTARRMGKPINELTRTQGVVAWICRVVAAAILLQTLFFKFTAAPESVYILTKVGVEPWGRIGSGIAELIAAILLFVPGLTWLGAALALGIMGGAVLSHLTVLGIEVT
jgi:hypothetical protein